jgi:ATP-dependent DNA helicase RecG
MNFTESLTVEFKHELTDAIKKEIIAFANTEGGALYPGFPEKTLFYNEECDHRRV